MLAGGRAETRVGTERTGCYRGRITTLAGTTFAPIVRSLTLLAASIGIVSGTLRFAVVRRRGDKPFDA
jgi:hypothetical protein